METVLALGLISIILVFLCVLFIRLIGTSDKSGDTSAGLELADSLLQQCIQTKVFEPPGGNHRVLLYTHDAAAATEFTYQISSQPTVVTPGQKPIYFMDVQVWWDIPAGSTRHGQGRLETHLSRLVTP
jgi:hypothetical protein